MIRCLLVLILLFTSPSLRAAPQDEGTSPLMNFDRLDNSNSITEEFPNIDPFRFEEPKSGFLIGFGISPVGIKSESFMFTVNFFQLHWLNDLFDIEVFSSSFGILTGESSETKSFNFLFRSAPKVRLFNNVSLGVIGGIEFVQYPEVKTKIYKDPYATPKYEPFSNSGLIYGFIASENFEVLDGYLLKLNQVVYFQSYSTEKTNDDWEYLYEDDSIRADTSPIDPDTVFMLEMSLLF